MGRKVIDGLMIIYSKVSLKIGHGCICALFVNKGFKNAFQ